jgi:hypothetical protein
LKAGNLAEYQKQVNLMKSAIDRAIAAGAVVTPSTPPPSGTPSTPPSTPAPTSPPESPTG